MLDEVMRWIKLYIIEQIDFNTIIILFCLMGVVAGFNKLGYIDKISQELIKRAKNLRILMLIAVLVTFAMSMLVTNDVGLIVMVPFTIKLLNKIGRKDKLIKLIVLETLAANLGGMATPIGNPQNVYVYQLYKMELGKFVITLLPYVVMTLVLLTIIIVYDKDGNDKVKIDLDNVKEEISENKGLVFKTISYIILFVLCLGVVFRMLNSLILLLILSIFILFFDRKVIKEINYGLLIKFIILFIIVGNLSLVPLIKNNLYKIVVGNEFFISVGLSQVLSNVPATIMLSKFTQNGYELMLGANIGGLGTMIASMASMISYEYYVSEKDTVKGRYILEFTRYNVLFMIIMVLLRILIDVIC